VFFSRFTTGCTSHLSRQLLKKVPWRHPAFDKMSGNVDGLLKKSLLAVTDFSGKVRPKNDPFLV